MAKKGGLGRGLDSLFQDTSIAAGIAGASEDVTRLRIIEIEPDKEQPRKVFDETALTELAASIAEHGVLQPIVVRPNPTGGYKIVAGERRWRASRLAGLAEVPVMIMEITDEQAMEIALIENLQREDLDPVEEAFGYKQLMDRCHYTQEMTAKQLSKSRSAVANSLRLLNLPKVALAFLREGKLTAGHAKVILSLETAKLQQEAAEKIVAAGMNVREAETMCKKMAVAPKQKPRVTAETRPTLPSEVELSLKEVLGTEVHVQYKDGKGTLNLGFYSDEQLRKFANLLGGYKQ